MRETTKDEFFKFISPLNVHPSIEGKFPYTSIFKTPSGIERGRIVYSFTDGFHPINIKYFITKE